MKSRAERALEAVRIAEEHAEGLWVLAVQAKPQRRAFLAELAGLEDRVMLKLLARLANADLLAETDGLIFALATPELAAEVLKHMEPDELRELNRRCLQRALTDQEETPVLIGFALAAGEHRLAGERLLAELHAAEEDAALAALIPAMDQAFLGLAALEDADPDLVGRLGFALAERGGAVLRPRRYKTLLDDVRARFPDAASLARLDAFEAAQKERAKKARQAAKAEKQASASAELSVDASAGSAESTTSPEEAAASSKSGALAEKVAVE